MAFREFLNEEEFVMFILRTALVCVTLLGFTTIMIKADPSRETMALLWRKAADYMRHYHWVPGKVSEHEIVYDLAGKMKEERRVVCGISSDNQNRIQVRILAAEKNGRDIKGQAQANFEGHFSLAEFVGDSPFSPDKDQMVTSHFNGRERRIKGHPCAGFAFTFHTGDTIVEGTAWLDQQSGLPLEIHYRITSVPFMDDGARVTAYAETEYYRLTAQGHCLLDHSRAEMTIELPGYGFEGQVTATRVFKDHWKYESMRIREGDGHSHCIDRSAPSLPVRSRT